MIPGRALHRLASLICSPETLHRVVEPAIADLQKEFAGADGASALRRAGVLIAGYGAIVKVIAICAASVAPANVDERRELTKALAWSGAMVLLSAALLTAPPMYTGSHTTDPSAAMGIAIQAAPLAIPLGFAFGIAFGLRRRASVTIWKLILLSAFAASVLSFIILAWGVPATSEAFGFHFRLALAVASVALTSMVLVLQPNGRSARGALAFTACLAYWMLMYAGELGSRHGYLPVLVGAWLPNVAMVAMAILIVSSRSSRLRDSVGVSRSG
ncbi:MAG TPA: LptF/LptG family permease [Vicinamibacterales bacterium]|nr:LptF/LptG family permease [Vicinamibacterales bacterium]